VGACSRQELVTIEDAELQQFPAQPVGRFDVRAPNDVVAEVNSDGRPLRYLLVAQRPNDKSLFRLAMEDNKNTTERRPRSDCVS
jgi:hypothetical protein